MEGLIAGNLDTLLSLGFLALLAVLVGLWFGLWLVFCKLGEWWDGFVSRDDE